ncbi:MAG TPA: exonuclease domain-containing protein [Burkholderiales bacterium]|nr:exonuclease domain-containing protein [Burkholderiales bacterium]
MKAGGKLALWVAILFAGGAAVPFATGLAVLAVLPAAEHDVVMRVLAERMPLVVFGAMALLALAAVVARWFFAAYVAPVATLAERTRAARSAQAAARVASEGGAELAQLAREIERMAADMRRLRADADARVRESRADLEEERNRLAALMSELVEGVLVCNDEGRVLLYNEQARALLSGEPGSSTVPPVGLGRSIFSLIDREQVVHAIEKLERSRQRGEAAPRTRFVAPTGSGRLVKFEAVPYRGARAELGGIVFTLGDVTGLLEREAQRLAVLQSIATQARAPVANIRAAAENLARYPEMESERQRQFVEIIASESLGLSRSIQGALQAYGEALKASLVLEDMRVLDLLRVAEGRIRAQAAVEVELEPADESLWLAVDSFTFVQALCFLAARLKEDYRVRQVRLRARRADRFVELDLGWRDGVVAHDALVHWEHEPLSVGAQESPLTLRDVLERHGGELWRQRQGPAGEREACFRFLLPAGEPVAAPAFPPAAIESRPEFYDFDLFAHGGTAQDLRARTLGELSYTVFDMETTGLAPSAGDEIISVGAVRIVNGRLLKSEIFEKLVDPRRPLNPDSAKVHGIDARMLEGQPAIEEVLPGFHKFCEDTVLVAHNAAFDMRFLELKQKSAGVRFEQPVLDTLLLSAVAQPGLQDHRLEAIAERLGVPVIGRHTAVGDALLTGEVFLRLLALLRERDIATLGQALDASRETFYARLRY